MKTGFVIAALTIVLLAGGTTGASLAGDTHRNDADPEGALGWTSQIRGPIGADALPDAMGAAPMSRGTASNNAVFSFVEIGGVGYRVGLDTGP